MRNTLSILTAAAISAVAFVPALAAVPVTTTAPSAKAPHAQSKIMKSTKKSGKTFSKKRTSLKKAAK